METAAFILVHIRSLDGDVYRQFQTLVGRETEFVHDNKRLETPGSRHQHRREKSDKVERGLQEMRRLHIRHVRGAGVKFQTGKKGRTGKNEG